MTEPEKITIKNRSDQEIIGILERKETRGDQGAPDRRERLVLILHGVLGHKDYLFQRLLAENLPYSSFRFDFRGNGESGGAPGYANIPEDVEDIHTVANYFENKGYEIYGVIGHSRGSVAGLKYATVCEKPLSHVVNISGRFKMNDNQIHKNRPEIGAALVKDGSFDWSVKQRDRINHIKVTWDEVNRFTAWDNSHVSRMPLTTCVLTCHGLDDTIVPPYNAAMFANKIPNHKLILLPDCDHNFKGKYEVLVDTIVSHLKMHERDPYAKALAMGQHVSLRIPRWIDVEGVRNFRDLGGWPLKDGSGYIRERTMYRCAHLSDITKNGQKVLQQLNVVSVFDFRSDKEAEKWKVMPDIPGIKRYPVSALDDNAFDKSVMKEKWKGFFQGPEGFSDVYMIMLDAAKNAYRETLTKMLESLSASSRNSIVFHCTAGKDRTGVFAMLILLLCGVDEEIISREYELTGHGFWMNEDEIHKRAKSMDVDVDMIQSSLSAPYEGMKKALVKLKEKYGSVEGYLEECGITAEQCEQLRRLFVVPIRFEERQLFRGAK